MEQLFALIKKRIDELKSKQSDIEDCLGLIDKTFKEVSTVKLSLNDYALVAQLANDYLKANIKDGEKGDKGERAKRARRIRRL